MRAFIRGPSLEQIQQLCQRLRAPTAQEEGGEDEPQGSDEAHVAQLIEETAAIQIADLLAARGIPRLDEQQDRERPLPRVVDQAGEEVDFQEDLADKPELIRPHRHLILSRPRGRQAAPTPLLRIGRNNPLELMRSPKDLMILTTVYL